MRSPFAAGSVALLVAAGCATGPKPQGRDWPQHRLVAEQITRLDMPDGKQFDASGLLLLPSGELLTLANNLGPQLYRIDMRPDQSEARLVPTECFTTNQVIAEFGVKPKQLDCEGIARDSQGRFYVCEESRRWILRYDPKSGKVERLPIDWRTVLGFFNRLDPNASFEGIAVGRDRLYVANERTAPVIIVVDLKHLKVTGHFEVYPHATSFFGTHYSDLCWCDDKLWVLCRQHRVVLEVDPDTRQVLAEFDYRHVEDDLGYKTGLPISVGIMEGLAVNRDFIWLVTDNNGMGRSGAANDIRPTLVRCRRPDRKQVSQTRTVLSLRREPTPGGDHAIPRESQVAMPGRIALQPVQPLDGCPGQDEAVQVTISAWIRQRGI
jgi:hypothetical protein